MKFIGISLIFVFAIVGFSQTDKLVLNENVPDVVSEKTEKSPVSASEWSELESSLQREDWTKTSILAKEFLEKLEGQPKDARVPRLRYIYLFSLAGKVISYSFSGDRDLEIEAREVLESSAEHFVGQEFIFPVRKILDDCKGALNYVCESKENPGFVRVSATNSEGTSIHFSEYVDMSRLKLDVKRHNKSDVILGGILKGVRLNPERSNKLIMTLQFEDGFVDKIFPARSKE